MIVVVVTIVIMIVVVIVLEWFPKLLPSECVGRLDRKNPQHSSTKRETEFLFECSKALFICSDSSLTGALAMFLFFRVVLPVGEFH